MSTNANLMMKTPLSIASIARWASTLFPQQEIVSVTADNPRHKTTYGEAFSRAGKLALALQKMGAGQGDIIGTLAWNDHRHFEVYYGLSGSGLVCHTINPRLFPEQLVYIINHAEDRWLFVDPMFVPLLEKLQDQLNTVEGYIILAPEEHMPETSLQNALCYETLITGIADEFQWPELDENQPSSLCYTSGTTGNPKGVLYTHRSIILHMYASLLPSVFAVSEQDVVMPIVPMFHVNAWTLPYAAPAVGAKLVMPGNKMADGETLSALINEEGVTISAGVPTVWLALLSYLQESGTDIPSLNRVVTGGSACPWSIMETFLDQYGVYTHHAWGMTEMSPLGTYNPRAPEGLPREALKKHMLTQGKPVFGVELRIVDEAGNPLPWNGKDFGALQVRGLWILERYFKQEESALTPDGWFDTGDVAMINPDGSLMITDRTKDVIKSGGEWISSIDLENFAMTLDCVQEAAVIGVRHPKWQERPLLVVVPAPGCENTAKEDILAAFKGKVADWWIPEACEFVAEIPHTATGKISKKDLREQFADYQWPS